MTDTLWSRLGKELSAHDGEWLYRVGAEIRGPAARDQVAAKLLAGELGLDTPAAREGEAFRPIATLAAFAAEIATVRQLHASRRIRRRRVAAVVAAGAVLAVAAVVTWRQVTLRREERAAVAAAAAVAERARATREAAVLPPDTLPQMALAPLVSLGSEADVAIGAAAASSRPAAASKRKGHRRGGATAAAEAGGSGAKQEFVVSCQLSQAQIFATLRSHLAKLNVCVEDAKAHDTAGLLPERLSLQLVITPAGDVVDLLIDHPHFKRGALNNCMTKAFLSIMFPASHGGGCPVTVPIKIGPSSGSG